MCSRYKNVDFCTIKKEIAMQFNIIKIYLPSKHTNIQKALSVQTENFNLKFDFSRNTSPMHSIFVWIV